MMIIKPENLTLKEKIAQMFIMGFEGIELNQNNINIQDMVKNGLGGVIFFANNIHTLTQFAELSASLQKMAKIPLFTSIDQEGGLVERTINCPEKVEYLTPMALCASGKTDNVKIHTQIMADELKACGINMDFAPVLDVNTNPDNPIIGIRAFSNNPDEVIKYSQQVYKTFQDNNIISVGKHFPGHGEAWVDSHLDLPEIDLKLDNLEEIHIKPFKYAIENDLDAIMVAHVHYPVFNKDSKLPASLSKEVITGYLKNKLNFKGLIISDDMVMGGIVNHFNHLDACIRAINAGIDILIFRDSIDKNLELIDKLAEAVENNLISRDRINESVNKILYYKEKYNINKDLNISEFPNIREKQEIIDNIAIKAIKIAKKGNLIPLDNTKKRLILSADKSKIHSYAKDKSRLSGFLAGDCTEISYSLNPDEDEIRKIKETICDYDSVILVSYNANLNPKQVKLFNSINKPTIVIVTGIPCYDYFDNADSILLSFGYKTPNLKALAKVIST